MSQSSNGNEIALYGYWRSSCSWRVRSALNLKKIPYKYNVVHLKNGEQHNEKYKTKLNPMQQVPTLIIDNQILTQSLPIMEYLEETRKDQGVPLLSNDPKIRHKQRMISEIINSGIQPIQNLSVLNNLIKFIKKNNPNASSITSQDELKIQNIWSADIIDTGFIALETVLKQSSGTYCVGDDVSMADCCLVPQVFNALRFGADMKKFPNIQRVYDNCNKLKEFKASHANNQPDTPKESKL